MEKICKNCSAKFQITDDDLKFYDKVAPVIGGKKYSIPAPTHCPDCRLQRRLSWRNDRNLYERSCDFSGQKLISMFPPDSKIKVYHRDIWWSDKWDAKSYGRDFDFSRSFFEQFKELNEAVPHQHVIIVDSENCLYTNYNAFNKNSYLCFAGNYLEDSLYCYNAEKSKDCSDCLFVFECELCYECIQSENCYNTRYALHAKNCSDSMFIEDCSDSQNCFLCFNLQRKQYCILNKQYTRGEYFKELGKYQLNTGSGLMRAFNMWRKERLKYPKRSNHNLLAENCIGEYVSQSKNCQECFTMGKNCEDSKYIFNGFPGLKDAYDCSYCGENSSLFYESMATGSDVYHVLFGNICVTGGGELLYCSYMFNSKNCFGCSNMRNAEYCILNKQYTKEEYGKLVPKIIEYMKKTDEWGEFFPISTSLFAYNKTLAQEYFPLNKNDALKRKYHWEDDKAKGLYDGPKTVIPDDIKNVPDSIKNAVLVCCDCGKNYKIIAEELKFYRKMNLPLPLKCHNCRHKDRVTIRNPRKLWDRKCDKCSQKIRTTYASDRPEIVYCENCYLKEIY